MAVAPFSGRRRRWSNGVSSAVGEVHQHRRHSGKNEKLTTETAELRGQMVDYDKLKAENEAFQALTKIQGSNPSWAMSRPLSSGGTRWIRSTASPLTRAPWTGWKPGTPSPATRAIWLGVVLEVDLTSCQGHDDFAPQLQRGGRGVPHPGQRHHHGQRGLRC